jgi:hypothetical protein
MVTVFLILLVVITGCGVSHRPIVVQPLAYQPVTWQERHLALRQTWDTLVAERSARERRAARDQETEIREDAFRQLPYVSLAASNQTTLAEAISVLLADLPYTVVYGPQVEVATPLASHITHQRLDRAVATLVHPLGYQVTVEPTRREIYIAAMLTRHWMLPPRPATEDTFWTRLGDDLRALVHGEKGAPMAPGSVVLNPDAGDVMVSARVPRMPLVEAHMQHVLAASIVERRE